ncbi:MAG TPA: GNAT family N-acetyltransferase [Gemmatimonadaceae bacterium]|nr:GNAT family N-acetyltransferase [Gemmatimonadaceae bacterium]
MAMEAHGGLVIRLRPATADDRERLWHWRNDPATREASLNTAPVPFDAHALWFERQLGTPSVALFIIELGAERVPCGQLRLVHLDGDDALVSIGVAAECRGRGVATAALQQVMASPPRPPWAQRLIAVIKLDNAPSRTAFERAGFRGPSQDPPASAGRVPADAGVWICRPNGASDT